MNRRVRLASAALRDMHACLCTGPQHNRSNDTVTVYADPRGAYEVNPASHSADVLTTNATRRSCDHKTLRPQPSCRIDVDHFDKMHGWQDPDTYHLRKDVLQEDIDRRPCGRLVQAVYELRGTKL